jgi:hypothetical protein
MADEFDFAGLADSIADSPDPIAPDTPQSAEEKLVNSPDFESRRRSVGEFLLDNPSRPRVKKPRSEKPVKEKTPLPPRRRGSMVKPLEKMYGSLAIAILPFDQVCATAVMNAAPQCAEALDNLAYENEAVRRILVSMLQTSAIGAVLLAHSPIIMAIMMHHVPAVRNAFGTMVGAQTAEEAEAFLRNVNGNGGPAS